MNRNRGLLLTSLFLIPLLAGCTSVLDDTIEPRAVFTATSTEIQQGEEVTFDARNSDAIDGVITEYEWDFGDSETSTSQNPGSHEYDTIGTLTLSLTVSEDGGCTDKLTRSINIGSLEAIIRSVSMFFKNKIVNKTRRKKIKQTFFHENKLLVAAAIDGAGARRAG